MDYLNSDDILNIHSVIINESGGSHGVRDHGAIASLEKLPQQEAFGKELYPGMYVKAALYIRNIIFSHPFVDGNKRTAMSCADVFLQLNGCCIKIPKGGIEAFALSVIEKRLELKDIVDWVKKNSKGV